VGRAAEFRRHAIPSRPNLLIPMRLAVWIALSWYKKATFRTPDFRLGIAGSFTKCSTQLVMRA
jgi:hypothetical protein